MSAARGSLRRSAYRMPDAEAWFDIYTASYEPMGRIIGRDQDLASALEVLDGQRRKLGEKGLTRVATWLADLSHVLVGEAWLRGEPAVPVDLLAVTPLTSRVSWQEREMRCLALAYQMMRAGQLEEAEQELRAGLEAAVQSGLMRTALRLRLAMCALLLQRGQMQLARTELDLCLQQGAQQGTRQVFAHYASAEFIALVEDSADESRAPSAAVARFARSLGLSRENSDTSATTLTRREREVLSALAEGGSDKVLGRLLGMSEHGIRFHLKSIYRKFDVHDRASAIHEGRRLGII